MLNELRFIPSRVEGLAAVTEIAVFPDRLEVTAGGRLVTFRFADIARWPTPRFVWQTLYRFGIRPKWLPVGVRDWFHEPSDMFFGFYTQPRLKVFMPVTEVKEPYGASHFRRLQDVLQVGGFSTYDLG